MCSVLPQVDAQLSEIRPTITVKHQYFCVSSTATEDSLEPRFTHTPHTHIHKVS